MPASTVRDRRLDTGGQGPMPKLQFSAAVPTSDFFNTMRKNSSALDLSAKFGIDSHENGLERFTATTRRQHFLMPPRTAPSRSSSCRPPRDNSHRHGSSPRPDCETPAGSGPGWGARAPHPAGRDRRASPLPLPAVTTDGDRRRQSQVPHHAAGGPITAGSGSPLGRIGSALGASPSAAPESVRAIERRDA
jgi:hypothetical protein